MINKLKTDIKTLFLMYRQLIYIFNKRQKIEAIIATFLVMGGALLETIGVSVIMPFINAIMSPETTKEAWYVKIIANLIDFEHHNTLILYTAFLVVSVYIIKNIYLISSHYFQVKFQCRCRRDLSVKMMDHYLQKPFADCLKTNTSQVLREINDDVNGVSTVVENTLYFLTEFLPIILISIWVFMMDWFIALGMIIISLTCMLFTTYIFKNKLTKLGTQIRIADAKQYKCILETIYGIKDIHVMKKERFFLKKYEKAYDAKSKINISQGFVTIIPSKIIETVCVLGLLLLISIRVCIGINVAEYISILATVALAAFRILISISKLAGYINILIYNRPTLDAAYNNIKNAEENALKFKTIFTTEKKEKDFKSNIYLKNIWWQYETNGEYVIKDLSLKINKGDSIALIGASGSGKTTLAEIILGLLPPQKGEILVDGVNINRVQWNKLIGYIPQNIYFMDDTIKNNIAMGIEEEKINEDKIWEALKEAQLEDFVANLPNGLETVIGERGEKFSGGQAQRLAIARALYYDPEILILDEATSALDSETEMAVMGAMEELIGKKTLIVIAHRITTIKNCNRIFEVAEGNVIEREKTAVLREYRIKIN